MQPAIAEGREDPFSPRVRVPGSGTGTARSIRMIIVEDHALVREGTVQLLEQEPDIEVVGQAGSGEEALTLFDALRPDVALVDVNLPGMSGLELARQLATRGLGCKVLIVSAYDEYAYVSEALEVGVGGYLLKTASTREFIDAVRAVADGVIVLDAQVSARLRARRRGGFARSMTAVLSVREADVLSLLVQGRSNKEIAADLALGVRTVESYVSRVLAKLGVGSRTEAVAFALSRRLVTPGQGHDGAGP